MKSLSKTDSTHARQFEAATTQETCTHSALRVGMCSQGARTLMRLRLKSSHNWASSGQMHSQPDSDQGHCRAHDEAVDFPKPRIYGLRVESKRSVTVGFHLEAVSVDRATTNMDLTTTNNSYHSIISFPSHEPEDHSSMATQGCEALFFLLSLAPD